MCYLLHLNECIEGMPVVHLVQGSQESLEHPSLLNKERLQRCETTLPWRWSLKMPSRFKEGAEIDASTLAATKAENLLRDRFDLLQQELEVHHPGLALRAHITGLGIKVHQLDPGVREHSKLGNDCEEKRVRGRNRICSGSWCGR